MDGQLRFRFTIKSAFLAQGQWAFGRSPSLRPSIDLRYNFEAVKQHLADGSSKQ